MADPTREASSAGHFENSGQPSSPSSTDIAASGVSQSITAHTRQSGKRLPLSEDVMSALSFGLELIRHGAMLVAHEGHLHIANHSALAILQKKDGLSLSATGLVADRAADTQLLRRLLKDAITSPELGEPKDSPMTLPRKRSHNALIVRIVPGPGLECWPATENRAALMTLYDQDTSLQVDASVLCKLYGLTRGEAALAIHLLQGKSVEEAAAELFISLHTARTHLKRIFMKTDTHRQTELVVRIFSALV
ncbi:MAG TPA: helix-turn-helix transcriptional regulator [Candidatus Aquilonibacter sp.]|jgi:DNA-binding CsgD family transcriptional regulator|nr:helix-turn-helix transcriptional regulator [Candidatus Aquilonibacter sp.]